MEKLTRLQKEILLWLIICILVSGCSMYYSDHTPKDYDGIIRLHVVANSDSPEDQKVKLAVRNAIIKEMGAFKGSSTKENMADYIETNLSNIEALSNRVLRNSGFSYPAKAEYKVTFFPEKTYDNDLTLPPGNYEALNVRLGRGDGHNWWCIIYPRLCLIGKKKGKKIVLKSKILDILRENKKRPV